MSPCLYAAVTLAKNEQIRTVAALRSRLSHDFSEEEITEALKTWASYVQQRS